MPKGSAIYTSPSMKENLEYRQTYAVPTGVGAPITLEPVRMINAGEMGAATIHQPRSYQYHHQQQQQQQQQHTQLQQQQHTQLQQQQQWAPAKLSQPDMMETALVSQDNLPPGSLLDVYHHRITDIVGLPQGYHSMTATPVSTLKVVTSMPTSSATAAVASSNKNPFAPGELQIKFAYENLTKTLSVTILKGANLLSLDGGGLSNPFVKVSSLSIVFSGR